MSQDEERNTVKGGCVLGRHEESHYRPSCNVMPQVKELKELGVAGSATNEQADTEAGWRILNIASYLPLFFMSVTGYKQRLLQVRSKNCYRVTSKECYGLRAKVCYRLQAKNVTG